MKKFSFRYGPIGAVILLAASGWAIWAGGARAQTNSNLGSAKTDISGLWLVHDPGSGDWTSFFDNVPKPELLPQIIEENNQEHAREAGGAIVNTAARNDNCPAGELPMMMASSPPINVLQSKDQVLIGSESGRGRIIYTDNRPHLNAAGLKALNSGNGDSIGHWEADTLVVDTIGFPAKICDSRRPVMVTPGGGRAKDTTHLTERYRLVSGGRQLSVTFTWEDPTVFLKPHTYTYLYDLIPGGFPFEGGNDVTDADLLKNLNGTGRGGRAAAGPN